MLSGGRGEDEKNEKRVGFLTFSGWSVRDRSWDFTGMCKTNVDGNVFLKATQTKTREMIFQVCTVKGGPPWHTQYLSISSLINHSTSIFLFLRLIFFSALLSVFILDFISIWNEWKTLFDLLFGHISINNSTQRQTTRLRRDQNASLYGLVQTNCLLLVPLSKKYPLTGFGGGIRRRCHRVMCWKSRLRTGGWCWWPDKRFLSERKRNVQHYKIILIYSIHIYCKKIKSYVST